MNKIILVVDIETTGSLNQGGKIVEIGIVKLDLETGDVSPTYNSLIREPGLNISHTEGQLGWIFKNSDLEYRELYDAPNLDDQREQIQHLFDIYEATAYNKAFDFGFLKDRGFQINELPCPMILATPIVNLPSGFGNNSPKWPNVEEAWEYFFGDTEYIEAHRALDDAIHEAKIVHELYKLKIFNITNVYIQALAFNNEFCIPQEVLDEPLTPEILNEINELYNNEQTKSKLPKLSISPNGERIGYTNEFGKYIPIKWKPSSTWLPGEAYDFSEGLILGRFGFPTKPHVFIN